MATYIYSNFGAGVSQRNLALANTAVADSAARLSSGLRVTSGKFGAADLAASDILKGEVAALAAQSRGLSFSLANAQAREAYGDGVQALVARALEAAQTLAGAGTNVDSSAFVAEIGALMAEAAALNTTTIGGGSLNATFSSTATTVTEITTALRGVTTARAAAGADVAAFEYQIAAVDSAVSFKQEAQARFIGVDYAAEAANLTKNQILQQAAAAMVAQVNQSPNIILALFK
jgi:flagellin